MVADDAAAADRFAASRTRTIDSLVVKPQTPTAPPLSGVEGPAMRAHWNIRRHPPQPFESI